MPTNVTFEIRESQQGIRSEAVILTLGAPGITLPTAFLHDINSSIKL